MTECEKYEELISCLLDGEISGEEKDALTRHLAHCPSCQETYRTYSVLFPPQRGETDDVPGALLSGVMDRVAQAPAPAGRRIPRRAVAGWAAAAACVAPTVL